MRLLTSSFPFPGQNTVLSQKKVSTPLTGSYFSKGAFTAPDTLSLSHNNRQLYFGVQLKNNNQFQPSVTLPKAATKSAFSSTNSSHPVETPKNRKPTPRFGSGLGGYDFNKAMENLNIEENPDYHVYYTRSDYPGYIFRKSTGEYFLHAQYCHIKPIDYYEAFPSQPSSSTAEASSSAITGRASSSNQITTKYMAGHFPVTNRGYTDLKKWYPKHLFTYLESIPEKHKSQMDRNDYRILDIGAGEGKAVKHFKKMGFKNTMGINNQVNDPPNVELMDLGEMPEEMFEDDDRFHLILSTCSAFAPGSASKENLQKYLTTTAAWLQPNGVIFLSPANPDTIREVLGVAQSECDEDHPVQSLSLSHGDTQITDPSTNRPYQWVKLTGGAESSGKEQKEE